MEGVFCPVTIDNINIVYYIPDCLNQTIYLYHYSMLNLLSVIIIIKHTYLCVCVYDTDESLQLTFRPLSLGIAKTND